MFHVAHTEDGECDISSPKIQQTYAELASEKNMTWMLLAYTRTNGCSLDVSHTGKDMDSLIPHMKDDAVHFAIIKITAGNSTYGTVEKFILVTWVGKRVAPTKRSKASRHKKAVVSIIKEGAALEVHTSSVEDVRESNLLQKLYTARSNSRVPLSTSPGPKPSPASAPKPSPVAPPKPAGFGSQPQPAHGNQSKPKPKPSPVRTAPAPPSGGGDAQKRQEEEKQRKEKEERERLERERKAKEEKERQDKLKSPPTSPRPTPPTSPKPKPSPTFTNTKPSPSGFRKLPEQPSTTPVPAANGGLAVPANGGLQIPGHHTPEDQMVKEMGRLGRKIGVSPHPVRRPTPPQSPTEPRISTKPPNKILSFGLGSLQGKRPSMEDRHVALLTLPKNPKIAFFGVYDGHQGDEAAEFAAENFHTEVDKYLGLLDSKFGGDKHKALTQACISLDENFCDEASTNYWDSGTTVISALFDTETKKILVLNLGDSRCVLGRGGKAIAMSEDHKPWVEKEQERILAAGKYIEDNRINGSHAFSRSIGDREMKDDLLEPQDQAISPIPEFREEEMCNEAHEREFLILACDGLWDVMSNAEAVSWVDAKLDEESNLDTIATALAQHAIDIGSTDNVSVLIVFLPK